MDAYLDALCREIRATAKMAKGKILDTVYIGGGTPTTLSAGQLDRLLSCIEQSFSMETVQEFTVEAGRPDSITKEKLKVIRKYPAVSYTHLGCRSLCDGRKFDQRICTSVDGRYHLRSILFRMHHRRALVCDEKSI